MRQRQISDLCQQVSKAVYVTDYGEMTITGALLERFNAAPKRKDGHPDMRYGESHAALMDIKMAAERLYES